MSVKTGDTFKVVTAKKVHTYEEAPKNFKIKFNGFSFELKYGITVIADEGISEPMVEISRQVYLRSDVIAFLLSRSNPILKTIQTKK